MQVVYSYEAYENPINLLRQPPEELSNKVLLPMQQVPREAWNCFPLFPSFFSASGKKQIAPCTILERAGLY